MSKDEYRVIKPPPGISIHSENLVLGKSEKGPYLAAQSLYYADPCLRVWILDESNHERGEWVLTHCNKHLGTMLPRCYLDNTVFGPWILEDINYNHYLMAYADSEGATAAAPVVKQQSDCGYSFDEDDFSLDSCRTTEDTTSSCYISDLWVLGFHPYKEIVFLGSGKERALAYDMNSSKFQYLGNIFPTSYEVDFEDKCQGIEETFVYTPCKLDGHPNTSLQTPHPNTRSARTAGYK